MPQIGHDYFQGCFFCRPQIVVRSVPANKAVYVQLLQAANDPCFDLCRISQVFRRDVWLSDRLLHYLNSPLFGSKPRFIRFRMR